MRRKCPVEARRAGALLWLQEPACACPTELRSAGRRLASLSEDTSNPPPVKRGLKLILRSLFFTGPPRSRRPDLGAPHGPAAGPHCLLGAGLRGGRGHVRGGRGRLCGVGRGRGRFGPGRVSVGPGLARGAVMAELLETNFKWHGPITLV